MAGVTPRELHLDADLAAQMDVLADVALAARVAHEAGHGHVLAELRDAGGHQFLNRPGRILQPRVVGRVARLVDLREDVLHELLEVGRPRHEVGLAVDLDEDAGRVIGRHAVADQAFARGAPGLLRGAREPALAQNRVRLLEVAVRLGEGGLALHHPRARLVAELLHLSAVIVAMVVHLWRRNFRRTKNAGPNSGRPVG